MMSRPMNSQIALLALTSSQQFCNWLIRGSLLGVLGVFSLYLTDLPAIGHATGNNFAANAETQTYPIHLSQTELESIPSRPILQIGSTGNFVSEVQGMLKLLGYYNGAIDGIYEEETALAVANFQRAAGLAPDGIVGPVTWGRLLPAAIASESSTSQDPIPTPSPSSEETTPDPPSTNSPRPATRPSPAPSPDASTTTDSSYVELPILRIGMRGPAIVRLQERLRVAGVFEGVVDGIFGTETEAAVKAFQRNYQLEPDGIVGPATWTVLLR